MSDKVTKESEVTEKCLLPETEKNKAKSYDNKLGSENSKRCNVKLAKNNNANLKKDLSTNKHALETLLSEGEVSSGFETVSSVDSNIDPDDFDLSSTADEDDFNVVVEIENELAFQTHKGSDGRTFYWRNTRNTTNGYDSRPKDFSSDFTKKKHDGFRIVNKTQKYWHNNVKDKNYECDEYKDNEDGRDKKFSEGEAFVCRRSYGLRDNNWDNRSNRRHSRGRRSDHDSRLRNSRSTDFDSRQRRSRSSDCDSRTRGSRSSDRDSRTRYSRNSDYDNRGRGSEGSSDHDCTPKHGRQSERHRSRGFNKRGIVYKDRKIGARRSRSFGRNSQTGLERDSPPRKRRRSYSKSPTTFVWKRLEGRKSSREDSEKMSRNSIRKKERTPFLVELERKLKEADRLKESKKENLNVSLVQPEVSLNDKTVSKTLPVTTQNLLASEVQSNTVLTQVSVPKPAVPEMSSRMEQGPVIPFRPTFAQPLPSIPKFNIPLEFTFPEVSVDNLPLVLGSSGLPVYITLSGEEIPYDMDGRRIPVGPNGYYLPLDPTGRLFPHIVSPGNQAVPIHMTEDGVLRLPNSEPVPYGPPHKLPVDIDGVAIPIGPDSRPLFPCPNLPRQPPLNLLKMIDTEPVPPPKVPQVTPEIVPLLPQNVGSSELPPQPKMAHSTPQIPEMGHLQIPLPKDVPKPDSTKSHLPSRADHVKPQPPKTGNREVFPPEVTEAQPADGSNQDDEEPRKIDSALVDIIQNPSQKINKADLLKKYKKKAQERSEDILKCKEIEKNLGVHPSKGGVKRSTPMKLSQKKIARKSPDKDSNTTVTDMVLESEDSDSTFDLKSAQKLKKGSVEEILLSSDEEQDILKAICDTDTSKTASTNAEAKPIDAIAKKVQEAIKSLLERKYKPPVVGRFIVPSLVDAIVRESPNESPLLRNRFVLPFITPSVKNPEGKDPSKGKEKTDITFKFLPQEAAEKGKKPPGVGKPGKSSQEKSSNAVKFPVFTFDFAMQCDFTSVMIKNLQSKIAELETEVVKLKNQNANLIDSYKNVQAVNEKKSAELRKAHLDILERNNEIQALKSSLQKK